MRRKAKPVRNKPFPIFTAIFLAAFAVISFVSVVSLRTNRSVATQAETNCPGKTDVTGACNPACCDPQVANSCEKAGETCSLQNGYCKGGYSCVPASSKKKRTCTANICAWVFCSADDPTCCDTDTDPKCLYCMTNEECAGTASSSSESSQSSDNAPIPNDQRENTCFNLTADIEAKKEQNGYTFYPTLKVGSPPGGKDGHIQLFVDGGAKGTNWGWNRGVHNPFVINPDILGTKHLDGGSVTVNYGVKIDECNERGNYLNLTCRFSVSGGKPAVEGPSCNCNGCDAAAPASSSSRSSSSAAAPSSRSSSSPQSSSSSSSSKAPSADEVRVTVEYVAAKDAGLPRNGGVCLEKVNGEKCKPLDVTKTQQTVSFNVTPSERSEYATVRGYLVDRQDHIFRGTAAANLETRSEFAVKIDYKP